MWKLSIIILIFILGLYFTIKNNSLKENFSNDVPYRCPNILIQKGQEFYLYNSKLANVPGVNPVKFDNLEDYVEFVDWQRSQGIRCPVLYLQQSYDTQGNEVYKARPSPTNLQGGLQDFNIAVSPQTPPPVKLIDAGRDDMPYNINSYPGFDPQDQYIGLNTPLDQMYQDNSNVVSANPMDPNWGGNLYTQSLVYDGAYSEDEVNMV